MRIKADAHISDLTRVNPNEVEGLDKERERFVSTRRQQHPSNSWWHTNVATTNYNHRHRKV